MSLLQHILRLVCLLLILLVTTSSPPSSFSPSSSSSLSFSLLQRITPVLLSSVLPVSAVVLPHDSVLEKLNGQVKDDYINDRKGFTSAGILTGWYPPLESQYGKNTLAIVIGSNTYFAGTLMKEFLGGGAYNRRSLYSIANGKIREKAAELREYIINEFAPLLLDSDWNPSSEQPGEALPFLWVNPFSTYIMNTDKPFMFSDSASSFPEQFLFDSDPHQLGFHVGISQLLDPSALSVDKNLELSTKLKNALNAIRTSAKKSSSSDLRPFEQISEDLPSFSFHHMFGGWHEIHGVLVLKGLQEPPGDDRTISIPKPPSLRTLNAERVEAKLYEALSEYIQKITGDYLVAALNDDLAKPPLLMEWKDISEAERLSAEHYSEGDSFMDIPSSVPMPPGSFLLFTDPTLFLRLTQFGEGLEGILNDTQGEGMLEGVEDRVRSTWNLIRQAWIVSITIMSFLGLVFILLVFWLIWHSFRKKRGRREVREEPQLSGESPGGKTAVADGATSVCSSPSCSRNSGEEQNSPDSVSRDTENTIGEGGVENGDIDELLSWGHRNRPALVIGKKLTS